MYLIKQISDDAKQKHTLLIYDGTSIEVTFEYKPMQRGWFINELVHGDLTLRNLRVVTSPNMLHQFKNQIPFGLGIFVTKNQEPTLQQDFSSGRAKMYILDDDEVLAYEGVLRGQIST